MEKKEEKEPRELENSKGWRKIEEGKGKDNRKTKM
jgi:hypothetical protein